MAQSICSVSLLRIVGSFDYQQTILIKVGQGRMLDSSPLLRTFALHGTFNCVL